MTEVLSDLRVIYDLHSHTTASDGELSPEELVERAIERQINVLAITDHDTTAAITPANDYIAEKNLPLTLISGVEISTLWENIEIHIVGLNIDINHNAMKTLLSSQSQCRETRAMMIGERLEKAGIANAFEGAKALAYGGQVTRGHFARFLVNEGHVASVNKVFKRYLAKGKTGYVPPQWSSIGDAVTAIHEAGGVAVLAHPGRYGLSSKWLKRLTLYFKQLGGDAIEVAQCQQPPQEREQHAALAQLYGLKASLGSDFHRPCSWIELGRNLWLPSGVEPVWSLWQE
ncbi:MULTISPECIES: RNase RNM [Enterobacterales]|uniref:RNase RNM n=1 Tax=Enterobacterales TaxID=91347 RepID=UPI000847DC25|nr:MULTISPECIES: PHP domain-containing protein [Enterobacterales]ODQ04641.1 phosphatase [Shigella sp. FC130]OEI92174.1 phosphatase [Shigella sp. FC1655]WOO51472.1 PHP domain-containing protein [Hafnia alvei]WPF05945.1 PHP domain-containing protein [Proteus vulgaris]